MKKYIYITLLALGLFACDDSFLDKEPLGSLSVGTFYSNAEEATQAVNAIYDGIQSYTVYGAMSIVEDVQTDDAEKGGGGPSDQPGMDQVQKFIASADNHIFVDKWKAYFVPVFRANLAIQKIQEMGEESIDADVKKGLLAEAKFLRALCYFDLVTRFGDLPIVMEPNSPEDYDIARSPAPEVWAFIEGDLKEAVEGLKVPAELPDNDLGRATEGAAKALLAKAYVFQKKWTEADPLLSSVINDYGYELSDDFSGIFGIGNETNEEVIFQVNFQTGGASDREGYNRNGWMSPRSSDIDWGGIGFMLPTQDLVDEFEPGDIRLEASILRDGDMFSGDMYKKEWSPTGYNCRKGLVAFDEYTAGTPYFVDNNYVVIRLGDILLLKAETLNELDRTSEAVNFINPVRIRAKVPTIDADISKEQMREALYHERRVELCFEQKRYFDLVRWGKAAEVLTAKGYSFVAGKNELWPIPQSEIDINPNLAPNNPNW
ncbi:RagB/SusD family nutrient uptake outer membrane protein [Arenibacter aquaticus]|uniref:RagB/SusD family nutrient uptake outer membrane protein n=1 Tax=Arenibacter aquaticus TaxID=2489054 RepID=A0A430K4U4_9FLAO|nr:RagB/SusD family nutrient uptake outer membrane protein [Arenibacter aquaticus]RTE53984.1 RagB/SusD family nutrient uptake outer membrane protein [Arenibacter aquaticus]